VAASDANHLEPRSMQHKRGNGMTEKWQLPMNEGEGGRSGESGQRGGWTWAGEATSGMAQANSKTTAHTYEIVCDGDVEVTERMNAAVREACGVSERGQASEHGTLSHIN